MYFVVLVSLILLITMEYILFYREIYYLLNRLGIQFSVLYTPNT